jgi:osmotically-inducible protein OsmY
MILNKFITALLVTFISASSLAWGAAKNECKVNDSEILRDLEYKIATDKTLSDADINFQSTNCVVTISGVVKNLDLASKAVEIATSTQGVISVNTDNLVVDDRKQLFKDAYITAKVKGLFIKEKVLGDMPVSVAGVHVETKNGIVYLTGTATSKQAKNAEELAKSVDEVVRVESKIKRVN